MKQFLTTLSSLQIEKTNILCIMTENFILVDEYII